jgi:hypothetical protein
MTKDLDLKARIKLADLKKAVRDNNDRVSAWLDALLEIRETKLYLLEAKTFEEWCSKNCDQSVQRVRRLLAAERMKRDARLIAETTREEVITESKPPASSDKPGKPVVSVENTSSSSVKENSSPTKKAPPVYDTEGNELKFDALKFWARRGEVKEVMDGFKRFREELEHRLNARDPLWHEINFSNLEVRLDEIAQILHAAMPYAICPECQGAPSTRGSRCALCGNKALISKTLWTIAVPEEKKRVMAAVVERRGK